MTNGDKGSAPMVIVLKYNADAIRQCSRKLVGEVRDAAGRRVQITRSGSTMSETRTDVYGYNIRSESRRLTQTTAILTTSTTSATVRPRPSAAQIPSTRLRNRCHEK